jgi:hypothetical protein
LKHPVTEVYLIEQVVPETFTPMITIMVMPTAMVIAMVALLTVLYRIAISRRCRYNMMFGGGNGTLNNLVQFPSIQPHTPTLWAIVNLNTLPVTHHKVNCGAHRAFHIHLLMLLKKEIIPQAPYLNLKE